MSVAVVIVAAGRGRRMGGELPKQYISLGPKTVLQRAIEVFLSQEAIRWIVPVIHPDDQELCSGALKGVSDPRVLPAVEGSYTRALSVKMGLERLEPLEPEHVLIHDAARPFLPDAVVQRVIAALDTSDGACAALPVVDALWKSENNAAQTPVARDGLWRAQTPQGFSFSKILNAHRHHDGHGADDVTVAIESGLGVDFVIGSENNYKITTAHDLERALADAQRLDSQISGTLRNAAGSS